MVPGRRAAFGFEVASGAAVLALPGDRVGTEGAAEGVFFALTGVACFGAGADRTGLPALALPGLRVSLAR